MKLAISAQAHEAILRKVATAAVEDARTAWCTARTHPNERRVRAAFRACVFAARALRRLPPDSMTVAEAKRLEIAAERLKTQLVHIIEGPFTPQR